VAIAGVKSFARIYVRKGGTQRAHVS
jgi:hypothetical protein